MALELFCNKVLHRRVLKCHIREHPLESGVLVLKLFVALQIRRLHAAVPGFPLVASGVRNTVLAAQLWHLRTGVGLLEDGHSLGLVNQDFRIGTSRFFDATTLY